MRLPSFQFSGVFPVFERLNVISGLWQLMDRISAALSSTRPRIHYVYYFIAAFDVLAVALALFGSDVVFPSNSWRRRGIGGA